MDKQIEESSRNFVVSHQILSIVKIDFQKKAIYVSLDLKNSFSGLEVFDALFFSSHSCGFVW